MLIGRVTLRVRRRKSNPDAAACAQVNVAVQTNINVDLTQITERLIKHFDHEPELKARIAQALVEIDDEQCA